MNVNDDRKECPHHGWYSVERHGADCPTCVGLSEPSPAPGLMFGPIEVSADRESPHA